jgi:hypothetical protein
VCLSDVYQDHKINVRQYVCKYYTIFTIVYQYKYYKIIFEKGQALRKYHTELSNRHHKKLYIQKLLSHCRSWLSCNLEKQGRNHIFTLIRCYCRTNSFLNCLFITQQGLSLFSELQRKHKAIMFLALLYQPNAYVPTFVWMYYYL